MAVKTLRTVTDKFNLFNDGRRMKANKRNYVLSAVKSMINNPETQELLRLGEAYGYYGHQPRQRANKLTLGETEVITINGKPVVVDNVPSNITTKLFVDDDGNVTHEQKILDTPTGRIVDSLIESGAGGWSWATGGHDLANQAITRSYHGMDYVLQPNYLSLNHKSMILESASSRNDLILESLGTHFGAEEAAKIWKQLGEKNTAYELGQLLKEKEQEAMYLESVVYDLKSQLADEQHHARKNSMILEAAQCLPINMNETQKAAFLNMKTENDFKAIKSFFESVSSNAGKLNTLPMCHTQTAAPKSTGLSTSSNFIDFEPRRRRFE